MLFVTSACTTKAMLQALWDWELWASLTRNADILDIAHVEVRIAGEGARCSDLYIVREGAVRSNLRRLRESCITSRSPVAWPGHFHPLKRASETDVSVGNRTRDLLHCRQHTLQRTIWTALLTAIRNLGMYYYSSFFLQMSSFPAGTWCWSTCPAASSSITWWRRAG